MNYIFLFDTHSVTRYNINMIKLGIIYGGISTEHDVSIMSAKSILENLNKEKYEYIWNKKN